MKAIELPHLHGVRPEQLRRIRHVALDMDGTIYLGSNIFPWTLAFLDRLRSAGIGFSFLTNNPTRSVSDYLKKLAGMGIHVGKENMYSTPIATIDYIRKTWPQARRLFMLGTPSMASHHTTAVRTSMSCRNTRRLPFQMAFCSAKLMLPKIMSTASTISTAMLW